MSPTDRANLVHPDAALLAHGVQADAARAGFWSWLASIDQTKLVISFLGALAALVTPLTAYIGKRFELELAMVEQKQRLALQSAEQTHRLKLQTAEQQQKFITDFLTWVVKPERQQDSYYRRDVLNFFASALDDGRIKSWAQQELLHVNAEIGEIDRLKQEAKQAQSKTADLEAQRLTLRRALEGYRRQGRDSREAAEQAQRELLRKDRELQEASMQAAASAARVRDLTLTIGRHVEYHNPCPKGWLFTTSAADASRGLVACAVEAPRSPGVKVWVVRIDGAEVSCGCQPQ